MGCILQKLSRITREEFSAKSVFHPKLTTMYKLLGMDHRVERITGSEETHGGQLGVSHLSLEF